MPAAVAIVEEIIQSTSTSCLIRLSVDKAFTAAPGQFILVKTPVGKTSMKAYSIASPPSLKGQLELCIRKVGDVSNYMSNLKGGERLEILGPAGHFVLREPVKNDVIFVATGTGISALKPMIDVIFEKGTKKDVWLFFGNRSEDEIIYLDHFEDLPARHKNFHFIPVLSRADVMWKGERGHVQDPLKKYIKSAGDKEIYICGVLAMVEEVSKIAEEMGFLKEKIYFEKYV